MSLWELVYVVQIVGIVLFFLIVWLRILRADRKKRLKKQDIGPDLARKWMNINLPKNFSAIPVKKRPPDPSGGGLR